MSYLVDIILDDSALPEPTPEIAQERRVAIFDLLQENEFILLSCLLYTSDAADE